MEPPPPLPGPRHCETASIPLVLLLLALLCKIELDLLISEIFRLTAKYMTSTTTKTNIKYLTFGGVAAGVLLLAAAGTLSISGAQLQEQGQEQQQQANSAGQNGTTTTTKVEVGGGGPTPVVMAFTPQNVTINAGQTVVWTNPTVVPEPHTVSFIKEQGYFPLL